MSLLRGGHFFRTLPKLEGQSKHNVWKYAKSCYTRIRHISTTYNVVRLKERGVVRVFGPDSLKFLQGLLTNNMNCFAEKHCQILFAAALNAQGRILFDLFTYLNPSEENHFLLEADEKVVPDLIRHLKAFKLRAKVDILDARKEIETWFIFPSVSESKEGIIESVADDLVALPDPRLSSFGTRVLLPFNRSPSEMIPDKKFFSVDVGFYQNYRHKFGIAEGASEIIPEKGLPLEYNFGILNGISFSKGCYIGQELTARTHHTGVIRKRVMPIQLKDARNLKVYPDLENHISLKSDQGKSAGTIIKMAGGYGIGMLRVNEAISSKYLLALDRQGNEVSFICKKPGWWPTDLKS